MSTKNIVLLLTLVALVGVSWWQFTKKTKDTFAGNVHTQFAVEKVEDVQRIFIADRNGRQVLLERSEGDLWMYTNKVTGRKWIANPSVMHTLLQTIGNVRTRMPVAKAAVENVVKNIAAHGKKVEIYTKSGERIRTYYVGSPAERAEGTHFMMEGAEMPYIVYYPSWVGSLDTRYSTDEKTWRDRAIFRIDPTTLEWVEVEYVAPSQLGASFRLDRKSADEFEIKALNEQAAEKPTTPLNKSNAATFADDFGTMIAESIIDAQSLLDSVKFMPIFATVRYKTSLHERAQVLRFRPVMNPTADRGDGDIGTRQKIQRYIVEMENGDVFLIQHLVARKLFWNYNYFFQNAEVVLKEDESMFVPKGDLPTFTDSTKFSFPFVPQVF